MIPSGRETVGKGGGREDKEKEKKGVFEQRFLLSLPTYSLFISTHLLSLSISTHILSLYLYSPTLFQSLPTYAALPKI